MRCDSCVYKRLDGHLYPCYKCVECGYPYLEEVPTEELLDMYKNEKSPFSYPAAPDVMHRAEAVLKKDFPNHTFVGVWRKSLHPQDRCRYFLVAENSQLLGKERYCVWTCFNDKTGSLEHGHYNISNETVSDVMHEHFVFI